MISDRSRSGGTIVTTIVLAILLTLCSQALMAQSQNISGTVVDSTGGVIPQASVKITDSAKGGLARETSTDGAGRFQAINIQPGSYLISVEKTGFKKVEVPVKLDVNMKLDVGNIQQADNTTAINLFHQVIDVK